MGFAHVCMPSQTKHVWLGTAALFRARQKRILFLLGSRNANNQLIFRIRIYCRRHRIAQYLYELGVSCYQNRWTDFNEPIRRRFFRCISLIVIVSMLLVKRAAKLLMVHYVPIVQQLPIKSVSKLEIP